MSSYLKYFVLIAVLTTVCGCSKKTEPKEKQQPPAKVQNVVKETDLTTF